MIGCAQLSLRLGKLGRVDKHGDVQPDNIDDEENEGYGEADDEEDDGYEDGYDDGA